MNHYPRHIGDWRVATGKLTRIQRDIYSDLIDTYYDKEQALTSDLAMLSEDHGCRSEEERAALDYVLKRYFKLGEDGLFHHERCDEEIAAFHHIVEVAKKAGKASASARAERRQNGAATAVQRTFNAKATTGQPPNTQYPPSSPDGEEGGAAAPSPPPAPPPATKTEDKAFRPTRKPPKDFTVNGEMAGWAARECPCLTIKDIERETSQFKDHTFGRPITDWVGAWRNWLRKEQKFRESRLGRGPVLSAKEAERQRVLDEMQKENLNGASKHGAIDVETRIISDPETDEFPSG